MLVQMVRGFKAQSVRGSKQARFSNKAHISVVEALVSGIVSVETFPFTLSTSFFALLFGKILKTLLQQAIVGEDFVNDFLPYWGWGWGLELRGLGFWSLERPITAIFKSLFLEVFDDACHHG